VSDGRPGKSTTAYSPDEMNIYNGDYPLRLPLYLYVRSDKQAAHKDALKWLFSEAAADQIRALGLYPAPKAIRERLAQRLDSR
jgi:ABC-type phosphate transport system substrate-binding protein